MLVKSQDSTQLLKSRLLLRLRALNSEAIGYWLFMALTSTLLHCPQFTILLRTGLHSLFEWSGQVRKLSLSILVHTGRTNDRGRGNGSLPTSIFLLHHHSFFSFVNTLLTHSRRTQQCPANTFYLCVFVCIRASAQGIWKYSYFLHHS